MSKSSGKKSFLDYFRVKPSEDEYDDDYFEDEYDDNYDDDYEESYVAKKPSKKSTTSTSFGGSSSLTGATQTGSSYGASYSSSNYQTNSSYSNPSYKKTQKQTSAKDNSNLVSFDNTPRRQNYSPSSEVYVIKPLEFDDAQTVSDFLKSGKTIVINMEGVQLDPAQRIIDFIGGACYGLGGDLKAISANIFIAAPGNIEVSGDLRDEILNESTLSPQLGKY